MYIIDLCIAVMNFFSTENLLESPVKILIAFYWVLMY